MTSPASLVMQPSLASGAVHVTRSQSKKMAAAMAQVDEPVGLLAVSYPWTKVFRPGAPHEEHMRKFDLVVKQVEQYASDSAIPPMTTGLGFVKTVSYPLSSNALASMFSRIVSIVSWSSTALTKVLDWRNPQGEAASKFAFAGRVIATEVALCVLPVAAAIESVVYGVLAAGAYVLGKSDSYNHNVQLLKSSAFTIVWATADLLFYNIFRITVPAEEWDAWTQLAAVIKR